jgi:hypothetical protein
MVHCLLHKGFRIGRKAAMEIKIIAADRNYMPRGLSMVE